MLKHVVTKTGQEFVYDDQTATVKNNIFEATFILLRAEKILRTATRKNTGEKYEATNYQYSSELFTQLQMCRIEDIILNSPADKTLTELYKRISQKRPITGEIREILRRDYLKVIDLRDAEK
ncbi:MULTISPECIES: hypothetical protein [Lacticaseibacillus]|uniref:hypothetical protein n=1 Tax=Lacticaseibacillus TaxID=2759736 RepID=UPI00063DC70E|nr:MULTISPECIES: hypothetical protein [Lacticaseibacillus]KLI74896.1 hypothetical protein AAW28_12700 [Lacticaseibacillus casei]